MHTSTRWIVLGIQFFAVAGCSWFTPPLEQPVIEEKLNPSILSRATVGTLSLTPERRVVLVNFDSNRFCAEAPTEIGTDISRFFQIAASADVPKEVQAKIGAAMAASSQNSVLNRRTQGMQLFLANSYFVCQMYMNKAINEKQVLEYQTQVFDQAAKLIEIELPFLYQAEEKDAQSRAALTPLDINAIVSKILELKDEPVTPEGTSGNGAGTSPTPRPDTGAPGSP